MPKPARLADGGGTLGGTQVVKTMPSLDSPPPTFPRVLIGSEGWRFLGNGNNFSFSQMVGLIRVSGSVSHQWSNVLRSRAARYGSRTKTFIRPENTCVYQRYMPDNLHVTSERFATFLADVGGAHYIFCDYVKHQNAGDLYHRAIATRRRMAAMQRRARSFARWVWTRTLSSRLGQRGLLRASTSSNRERPTRP